MNNVVQFIADNLKSKDFWVKVLFIVIAAVFWLLIKLSSSGYVTSVEYPVMYENIPQNKVILGNVTQKISLRISSYGFKLLGYELNKEIPLRLDVKRQARKSANDDNIYYWLPNLYTEELEEQLDGQTSLLRIEPDTVFLVLSDIVKKHIPVKSNVKVSFKKGYEPYANPVITPDKIIVSGPKLYLDTIDVLYTKPKNLIDVSKNITTQLMLKKKSDDLVFDTQQITYSLEVAKITEEILEVPVRITNVPIGYNANIIPAAIDVSCKIALKDFDNLTPHAIDAVCDFSQLQQFPNRKKLEIKVSTENKDFKIVNVSHNYVDYLLFKK